MDILKLKLLRENAVTPKRATQSSAGYDLCAAIDQPLTIAAGGRSLIPTGIAIEIGRADVAAFVFGRSGLAVRHGLVPSNAVGVIDSDYRGEIMVCLSNLSDSDYTIAPSERIAQLVFLPILTPQLVISNQLEDTVRGEGGFGSTGR